MKAVDTVDAALAMPLLGLPNELLLCLSEQLESTRGLNAFTRANVRLYFLLNNHIYRRDVQWSGSSVLVWAACQGREATLEKSLKENGNIRVTDAHNRSLLSFAAENGHDGAVNLLLREGVDPEAKDTLLGWTPLLWATWQGQEGYHWADGTIVGSKEKAPCNLQAAG